MYLRKFVRARNYACVTQEVVAHLPDADDQVRESVRALIKGKRLRVEDVAPAIGMVPSTMYRKLAGQGRNATFSAGEAHRIAVYFGCPITDLYDGLGGRFLPRQAVAEVGDDPSTSGLSRRELVTGRFGPVGVARLPRSARAA